MSEDLFSQNSEIAILSLMLKSPESMDKIREVKPEMFSSMPNRTLFGIVLKIYSDGYTPEYSLLVSNLKSRNLLANVGGESYIQYLYTQNYDANNVDEFIRIVTNSFKTRRLMSIYSHLSSAITEEDSIDKVIIDLKESLESLEIIGSADSVVPISGAVESTWRIINEKVARPDKIDITTNFKNLDGVTGGYGEGELWVVAGRPGMGKSSFLCNSALSGVPTLIFSLEMSKEILVQRMLSIRTGIPAFSIRNGLLNKKELEILHNELDSLSSLPIFIDSKYFVSPEYVSSTIRKYVKNNGVKLVHIDYVQLLIERTTNATHDIGRLTRELKLLSNDLKVTSVIYSQLNRLVEMREDKRPILSDLRQSGNIEEDVDTAIFLYRDEVYNPNTKDKTKLEFLIRKQRNGPTGVLYGFFDGDTNRMREE